MDDERFNVLYSILVELAPRRGKRQQFSDACVLLIFLWSALRNKPVDWACDRRNRPRAWVGPLPSPSCVSRRLRSASVQALLDLALRHWQLQLLAAASLVGCWIVDAKGFAVNRYSKDKQALRGHCCIGKARGYKLFLLVDAQDTPVAWHVDAMNAGEPTIALKLLQQIDGPGYLLGDSIYDSTQLYELAAARQVQLVAPRKNPMLNVDRRCRCEPRMHSIAMLETPVPHGFGPALYERRTRIERVFARWSSSRVGLDHLPGWVRTLPRVRRWILAKILIAMAT